MNPVVPIVGLLIVVNVAVNLLLPGWAYIPAMVAGGGAAIWIAARSGVTAAELGLDRSTVRRSIVVGSGAGVAVGALIAVGMAIPGLRDLYTDERAVGIGIGGLLYQTLIRIPLGTAVGEELMFRSAVLGVGVSCWSRSAGIAVSAGLFGLWHVLPTLTVVETNAAIVGRPAALVVLGAVAVTAAAGAVFVWMRLTVGHVIGSVLVHAFINSTAFVVAFVVAA